MFHLLTASCFLASGLLALCLLVAIDWRTQRLSTPVLPARSALLCLFPARRQDCWAQIPPLETRSTTSLLTIYLSSIHNQQLPSPATDETLLTQSCSLVRVRLLLALLLLALAVGAPLSVFSLLPADPWIEALFTLLYLLFLLTSAWELRGRAWLALTWQLNRRATPAKW